MRNYTGGLLNGSMTLNGEFPFLNRSVFPYANQKLNMLPTTNVIGILLYREHNRRARQYSQLNPSMNDEAVFQYARSMVIAFVQKVTFEQVTYQLL